MGARSCAYNCLGSSFHAKHNEGLLNILNWGWGTEKIRFSFLKNSDAVGACGRGNVCSLQTFWKRFIHTYTQTHSYIYMHIYFFSPACYWYTVLELFFEIMFRVSLLSVLENQTHTVFWPFSTQMHQLRWKHSFGILAWLQNVFIRFGSE